jgi:hypothetical protein
MGILNKIQEWLMGTPAQSLDRYKVLAEATGTLNFLDRADRYVNAVSSDYNIRALLTGRQAPDGTYKTKALAGYKAFVKSAPRYIQQLEAKTPMSGVLESFRHLRYEVQAIEDKFVELFSRGDKTVDIEDLRVSSLMMFGFLNAVDAYIEWVGMIGELLNGNFKTPYYAKLAESMATQHVPLLRNTEHSSQTYSVIEAYILDMRKRGVDLQIKSDDTWFSTLVDDAEFTPAELDMLKPQVMGFFGVVGPIVHLLERKYLKRQQRLKDQMELMEARIVLVTRKLEGLDPESPEYIRLSKVIASYADSIAKLDQEIDRSH